MKKTLFFSFAGHLACFGFLGLSFGHSLPRISLSDAFYWGTFRRPGLSVTGYPHTRDNPLGTVFLEARGKGMLRYAGARDFAVPEGRAKPQSLPGPGSAKAQISPQASVPLPAARKEQSVMFYPRLPYQVSLYFKDRQVVHIELMFNVVPESKAGDIFVKRKVSSGNLEADLLSMRYISRYLSVQRMGFAPGSWQSVAIELSTAKDDTH
ncbi:MAG: hypothetical protein PHR11_03150 [Candidatus Omnitrophica bacterium]|nr:hypothetical protein [Candidatus Omnitrophota bacterium]